MLSGQIPDSLSNLKKLQLLWLDDNILSGDITSSFNEMPELQAIFLEDNNFEGSINEDFLRQSKGLRQLDVSDNQLEGTLPSYFFNANEFSQLELMDWHGNNLSGRLPDIATENQKLQFISLYRNSFTGSVPSSWGTYLTELFHLDISRNNFSGDISASIGEMRKLKRLFVGGNDWTSGTIPSWLANLTELRELSLKNTRRTGPFLMDALVNLRQLVFLDLDNNSLEGSIPSFLSQLTKLEFLLLNRNRLSGAVPTELESLTSLRAVFLEGNSFTGDMAPVCNLPNFQQGNDSDRGVAVADCRGTSTLVECTCCTLCCEASPQVTTTNTAIKEVRSSCHDWTGPANLNPRWENVYERTAYVFGSQMWFDAD
jgi:Leucine-rich repeat (LRR) protein